MLGRPFEVVWHEQDTAEALKTAFDKEGDLGLRKRLHGLWLLRSGWRLPLVVEALGVHYRTVQRWVGWYREGGIAEVLRHKMGGKGQVPFLSEEVEEEVAEEVATGRFRTAAEVRDWIAGRYGVTYKKGSIYGLLHRLECSPKVPRPIHAKADQTQQADWKKGGLPKPLRRRESGPRRSSASPMRCE